jgi:predicted Fe-Mo cluster-binding NifX family protein
MFWHASCIISGMKLAITVWNGRIAPLFDVAKHLLIIETEGFGRPIGNMINVELSDDDVEKKISALSSLGINAVVCGAISREYEEALLCANIEMDAFVAGDVAEVLEAWQGGSMRQRVYSMPGCPCPRHRCMHRNGGYQGRGQGLGHGGGHRQYR